MVDEEPFNIAWLNAQQVEETAFIIRENNVPVMLQVKRAEQDDFKEKMNFNPPKLGRNKVKIHLSSVRRQN